MVELTEEMIDVMKKVKDDTKFTINRFEVGSSGAGGDVMNIDIRRHKDGI